ncbi:radical SAM protein [Thioalkalivibrio sp. XN279]|nr:radical SAM protein [Thioalkalivibrio sp. XN279]
MNWHITEACNYRCDFCYAKWVKPKQRELIHDGRATQLLLEEVHSLFSNYGTTVRLNLAGGEPLLYPDSLMSLVTTAKKIGFDVSIITNGSQLDRTLLEFLALHLSMIGVSIDSGELDTNLAIGRADKRNGSLRSSTDFRNIFEQARRINPDINLKVNTVVNSLNWKEDMNALMAYLQPQRWKVLQLLPTYSPKLAVTARQFTEFVERHANLSNVMNVEDNESMTESYIMIDPIGRFFQNSRGADTQYRYSQPILSVGARVAFSELVWNARKFASRYANLSASQNPIRQKTHSRIGSATVSPRQSPRTF